MKICFITYNIFDLGGIQRVTSVIANELSKQHSIKIICTSGINNIDRSIYNLSEEIDVEINENLKRKNIFIKIIYKLLKEINKNTGIFNNKKMINILTEIYYPKKIRERFIKYINDNKFDVVIGVAGEYSLLLGTISDKINAKTIGWQHNSFDAYLRNEKRYFWNQDQLFKNYISNLNEYIVLNDYDKEMFKKEFNIDSKVIYNPKSFISNEKSKVDNKQFLAAGRFNYQKGFDLLIEAFNLFSKLNSDWNLVLVGEGEEKDKIQNLINKYNLNDRIILKPATDNIKQYFLKSSILLLPSRWEGMPMIVLEALEMGMPTITYNISAIYPLIKDKKEGIVVTKYDIEKFAEAMNYLANNNEIRKKMSDNCIKKSKEFEISKIINKWNQILLYHS